VTVLCLALGLKAVSEQKQTKALNELHDAGGMVVQSGPRAWYQHWWVFPYDTATAIEFAEDIEQGEDILSIVRHVKTLSSVRHITFRDSPAADEILQELRISLPNVTIERVDTIEMPALF
jgi:hypothetical protein